MGHARLIVRALLIAALVFVPTSFSTAADATPSTRPAVEPWADPALPVKDGVALWLDATRQPQAWAARDRALIGGEPLDAWYDASGHRRHATQPGRTGKPQFLGDSRTAAVRFDGEDDYLRATGLPKPTNELTVFAVAVPHSNAGRFRAIVSAGEQGKNDFITGFNLDLGPHASDGAFGVLFLNAEGKGFRGATNVLAKGMMLPLEEMHHFAVTVAPGEAGVKAYVNGQPGAPRDRRDAGPMRVDHFVVGARYLSNDGNETPFVQSHFDGDVCELIVYDRVLPEDERIAVTKYLSDKYAGGSDAISRLVQRGTPLERVKDPPAMQVLVPGFEARQLPVELTNINNVRYRDDGKLVALAYDGNVYLLSDTDGDGVEDKADRFFANSEQIVAPIGMALTPPGYARGRGLFVACKGKLALVVDTNGDDKADDVITVAEGWAPAFSPVDALGVAIGPDRSIYFGLGTSNFISAYLPDANGNAKYRLDNERGTILKVSPDFKTREIVCTGIRFPVGLAFNEQGDLFCTDQEGATWLPNGNPFDELLHIVPKRHYGFPPRHPKHLPDVVDEPSTFDYEPQHQSTCGLFFNLPVNGGPTFGPGFWRGDALVCGQSRGKLYRTKLVATEAGYVARNQQFASLPMLTVDSCVSPTGDLVVSVHSGNPDWGTGPQGKGKLYKLRYRDRDVPQPVATWAAGPGEVRVAFDRPLDLEAVKAWAGKAQIDYGRYAGAGDRFEVIRPGYAVVKRQTYEPRERLTVSGLRVTPDRRTLVLTTRPQPQAFNFALTLPGVGRPAPSAGEIAQHDTIDLAYTLHGVQAAWRTSEGDRSITTWLPHPDLTVSRAMTAGSAEHDAFWEAIKSPGTLTLRTALDLKNLIQPAVQPGSQLDYTPPDERLTVTFRAAMPFKLAARGEATIDAKAEGGQPNSSTAVQITPKADEYVPVELTLPTGQAAPALTVTFTADVDSTPRPLALRRFLLPWAKPPADVDEESAIAEAALPPQLAGGDWLRGREVFFGDHAGCSKCHTVNGRGSDLGPDLSNLIHRDYDSVLRDIREPSGALNPDYVASTVQLKNGRVFHGIMRSTDAGHFIVRGDLEGERKPVARDAVKKITPSMLSVMPTGLAEGIGEERMRDLMTFLLTEPLKPAPIERKGAPPPRTRTEVERVLRASGVPTTAPATKSSAPPLKVLFVDGPKDHGPSEHDYPAWQDRWSTLLGLSDAVTVDRAEGWPSAEQWASADVIVFYSANPGWTAERGNALDAFLARGGGLVYLHYAVNGHDAPEALADRIGMATRAGLAFRHGPVDLTIRDANHPITRGFDASVHFEDETYWNMLGDSSRLHLLADAVEGGQPRPQLWTRQVGKGRVFVSILGHYSWTFDDPLFRLLVLRGVCWTAGRDADLLSHLATVGARVAP